MWSTIVAISLGVTSLAALALFYYFRQRIARVEHKVDVMFQLIQEHNTARQFPPAMTYGSPPPERTSEPQNELIEISGDEEDSDSSSIVSDTEDPLTITSASPGENIRAIELKLSGAEASSAHSHNSEDLDDLDEISDIEEDGDGEQEIVFEEGGEDDGIDMNEVIEVKTPETGPETAPEEVTDGIVEEVSLDNIEEADIKTVTLAPEPPSLDLQTLTVKELKKLAADRKLSNYKSLRRPKLIELLESTIGE
jgi:hypothetical protein